MLGSLVASATPRRRVDGKAIVGNDNIKSHSPVEAPTKVATWHVSASLPWGCMCCSSAFARSPVHLSPRWLALNACLVSTCCPQSAAEPPALTKKSGAAHTAHDAAHADGKLREGAKGRRAAAGTEVILCDERSVAAAGSRAPRCGFARARHRGIVLCCTQAIRDQIRKMAAGGTADDQQEVSDSEDEDDEDDKWVPQQLTTSCSYKLAQ